DGLDPESGQQAEGAAGSGNGPRRVPAPPRRSGLADHARTPHRGVRLGQLLPLEARDAEPEYGVLPRAPRLHDPRLPIRVAPELAAPRGYDRHRWAHDLRLVHRRALRAGAAVPGPGAATNGAPRHIRGVPSLSRLLFSSSSGAGRRRCEDIAEAGRLAKRVRM